MVGVTRCCEDKTINLLLEDVYFFLCCLLHSDMTHLSTVWLQSLCLIIIVHNYISKLNVYVLEIEI